jgi:hypothetical protein
MAKIRIIPCWLPYLPQRMVGSRFSLGREDAGVAKQVWLETMANLDNQRPMQGGRIGLCNALIDDALLSGWNKI